MPCISIISNPKSRKFQRKKKKESELTIDRILKTVRSKNLEATQLFVNFSKTFDSIHKGKMKLILFTCGFPKENVTAIKTLYKNTKVVVRSPDGDTDIFEIIISLPRRYTNTIFVYTLPRLQASHDHRSNKRKRSL